MRRECDNFVSISFSILVWWSGTGYSVRLTGAPAAEISKKSIKTIDNIICQ